MTIGTEVKPAIESQERQNTVATLDAEPASKMRKGVYIARGTWQCDLSQIAMRLRKDGQAGWLYFVEDTSSNT